MIKILTIGLLSRKVPNFYILGSLQIVLALHCRANYDKIRLTKNLNELLGIDEKDFGTHSKMLECYSGAVSVTTFKAAFRLE